MSYNAFLQNISTPLCVSLGKVIHYLGFQVQFDVLRLRWSPVDNWAHFWQDGVPATKFSRRSEMDPRRHHEAGHQDVMGIRLHGRDHEEVDKVVTMTHTFHRKK